MKILLISTYPPARDGIGDYTSALRAALAAEGHDARVIVAGEVDGSMDEVLGAFPRSGRERQALLGKVEAWGPDLVHVQFAVAAFGARTLLLPRLVNGLRALRIPIVTTLHEVTRDLDSLRAVGRVLYRRVLADGDVAIVHSDAALTELLRLKPTMAGAAVVVPHPRAQLPEATTTPAALRTRLGLDGGRLVLAFGFIHVDKGLDDLVDAIAVVRAAEDRRDVRLLVAGTIRKRSGVFRIFELRDHLHLRKVRRAITRAGLTSDVVFSGYVDGGDVAPTFAMADVVALPYRRIEDSGVANLAAASGSRIVASDVGNLARYVGDPRRLAPPGQPRALAVAIEHALDASPADGAVELPGASFDEVIAQTLGVYADLVAGREAAA